MKKIISETAKRNIMIETDFGVEDEDLIDIICCLELAIFVLITYAIRKYYKADVRHWTMEALCLAA